MRPQVGGAHLRAGFEQQRGTNFFAQPLVDDAKHAAFGDGRMPVQRRLDFGAIDIFAAAQHHVLLSVDDINKAISIDARDVAGMQPAIGDRRSGGFGAVDIALDDCGTAHP